jgi:hypothetical protein
MDDFNISSLHESKNEWGARLLTILTPVMIEGLRSIFNESYKLCKTNHEDEKYLMTFQNFISRIPKWNPSIIESERKRIIERSSCNYLEELITCVHIIQLKLLTAIRAGIKQKKIDITIPKIDDFIHKTYIHIARKIYNNVYLFEINIPPLQVQKNNRELEIIIQECILNSMRESIPVEEILKAYMDETIEEDVVEEIKEEILENTDEKKNNFIEEEIKNTMAENGITVPNDINGALSFNNVDSVKHFDGREEKISAPKDISSLATNSLASHSLASHSLASHSLASHSLESDFNEKLIISDETVPLDNLELTHIDEDDKSLPDLLKDIDVEIL